MTIKIQAYQRGGIKTEELVDEFEFCCWVTLKKWLDNWGEKDLHRCPNCAGGEFNGD